MPILEGPEEYAERATDLRAPAKGMLWTSRGRENPLHLPRGRRSRPQPSTMAADHLSDVDLDERHDPAAVIEDLFGANGWRGTWRDGIYDYAHYHSRIHEVLGIARGRGASASEAEKVKYSH